MIVPIIENILALLECSWAIAALPICHAGSTLVALTIAGMPVGPEQEDRDDRPGQVVVGLHAAVRGEVAHLRCAVGLLAVGLLRLPIRRRLRRLAVLCRRLAWLPIGPLRLAVGLLAVGLLRALAVWRGHTSSFGLLQMLGRP
jgi:hypothetical protein